MPTPTAHKLDRIVPADLISNPRASLRSWHFYEPIIRAAILQHPKPYIYKPSNRSPSSVCSKARDAIRGKIAFDYPDTGSPTLTSTEVARWYSEIILKHDAQTVFIGAPEELRTYLKGASTIETHANYSYQTLDFDSIVAFTLLLSRNLLTGPVRIASPPDISLLPERLNLQILQQSDGSIVLL